MSHLFRLIIVSALFLLTSFFALHAQPQRRWEAGGGFGAVGYLGDLNRSDLISREYNLAVSAFVRRYVGDNLALRLNVAGSRLSGSDANYNNRLSRNLTMSAPLFQTSLLLEWDMVDINPEYYRYSYGKDNGYTPYFFGGIGLVYANPTVNYSETQTPYEWVRAGVQRDEAAQYAKTHLVIPLGAGFKYDLGPCAGLAVEISFQITNTDYLDGVSEAGNAKRMDSFQAITFKYMHRLGRYRCFPFRTRRR